MATVVYDEAPVKIKKSNVLHIESWRTENDNVIAREANSVWNAMTKSKLWEIVVVSKDDNLRT